MWRYWMTPSGGCRASSASRLVLRCFASLLLAVALGGRDVKEMLAADAVPSPATVETVFETTAREAPKAFIVGYFDDPVQGQVPRMMEVRDGLAIIEGDIVVGPEERARKPASAKGLTDVRTKLWPKGEVAY